MSTAEDVQILSDALHFARWMWRGCWRCLVLLAIANRVTLTLPDVSPIAQWMWVGRLGSCERCPKYSCVHSQASHWSHPAFWVPYRRRRHPNETSQDLTVTKFSIFSSFIKTLTALKTYYIKKKNIYKLLKKITIDSMWTALHRSCWWFCLDCLAFDRRRFKFVFDRSVCCGVDGAFALVESMFRCCGRSRCCHCSYSQLLFCSQPVCILLFSLCLLLLLSLSLRCASRLAFLTAHANLSHWSHVR